MVEKMVLAQIILDFQKETLPDLIERELKVDLEIPLKRAIVIWGPRRIGNLILMLNIPK